jgi:hypothetical protein
MGGAMAANRSDRYQEIRHDATPPHIGGYGLVTAEREWVAAQLLAAPL